MLIDHSTFLEKIKRPGYGNIVHLIDVARVTWCNLLFSISDPSNALVASNLSHVYVSLKRYHDALKEAQLVCDLRPDWPKVSMS